MTKPSSRPRLTAQTLRQYLAGPPAVSQRALAAAVGCNQSMISMLVRGKRVPSGSLAATLHAVTGVPLAALLGIKVAAPRRPRSRGDPGGRRVSP